MSSRTLGGKAVRMEGYLEKRSRGKSLFGYNWKKRYMILFEGGLLEYHKSKDDGEKRKEPKGVLQLEMDSVCRALASKDLDGHTDSFEILPKGVVPDGEKVDHAHLPLTISAPKGAGEKMMWMAVIKEEVKAACLRDTDWLRAKEGEKEMQKIAQRRISSMSSGHLSTGSVMSVSSMGRATAMSLRGIDEEDEGEEIMDLDGILDDVAGGDGGDAHDSEDEESNIFGAGEGDVFQEDLKESKLKKRSHILNEIVEKELKYVEALQKCVTHWMKPLEEKARDHEGQGFLNRPIVDDTDVKFLFMNMPARRAYDAIVSLNLSLLVQLKKAVPGIKKLREMSVEELDVQSRLTAETLSHFTPFLLIYASYANNHANAIKTLDRLRKDPRFVEWETTAMAASGAPLGSFLIRPVQRLPRYRLHLADLLKHTSVHHVDYEAVYFALEKIKAVVSKVDRQTDGSGKGGVDDDAENVMLNYRHSRRGTNASSRHLGSKRGLRAGSGGGGSAGGLRAAADVPAPAPAPSPARPCPPRPTPPPKRTQKATAANGKALLHAALHGTPPPMPPPAPAPTPTQTSTSTSSTAGQRISIRGPPPMPGPGSKAAEANKKGKRAPPARGRSKKGGNASPTRRNTEAIRNSMERHKKALEQKKKQKKKQRRVRSTHVFDGGAKQVMYDDGTTVQTNPDGRVIERRPDGSTVVQDPDGTKVEKRSDGATLQTNPDGTTIEKWHGTIVQRTPGGPTITVLPDGTKSSKFPSGASKVTNPDGSWLQSDPDGSTSEKRLNGDLIFTRFDGTMQVKYSDGRTATTFPDGTKMMQFKDGRRVQSMPSGVVIELAVDGTKLQRNVDGSTIRTTKAGRKIHTTRDGRETDITK